MDEHVILVHGTGAASPNDSGDQWWQIGGVAERALGRAFGDGLSSRPFHWSGANSEVDRRRAGARLATTIKEIAAGGGRVHLVGHSHGGSVIWHALTQLAREPESPLRSVASTCSVGTPYLKYGVRRADFVTRMLFLGFTAALASWLLFLLKGGNLGFAFGVDPWGTLGWGALTTAALVAAGLSAIGLLRTVYGIAVEQRSRRAKSHLIKMSSRNLALWSVQDEPTLGLVSSGSFDQKLTRWKSVSQLVNNVLARAFQGSDLPFLELRAVSPHAMWELANLSLPEQVDVRLVQRANAAASLLAGAARGLLFASSNAVSGLQALKRMLPERLTFKELVHTTYFDDESCLELLVLHVARHTAMPCGRDFDQSLEDWYQRRHAAATAQNPGEVALPSNRVGRYAGIVAMSVAAIAMLAAIAGKLLAERALAPTKPAYWLDLLSRDRLPIEVMARGNYDDFTPVLRRFLKVAERRQIDVPEALLQDALRVWPGAVRIPDERLTRFVRDIVASGQLSRVLDTGLFARLDDVESDSLATTRTRQTAIALATGTVIMAGLPNAGNLLSRLREACGAAIGCREESLVREIEALALQGRLQEARDTLSRHPGLDAAYREKIFPDYLDRQSPNAAPLERIVEAVVWLADNGMLRAAGRLAKSKLQWCAARPAASENREVDRTVIQLLARPVEIRNPYPSTRLDDLDFRDGITELAGCGRLTNAGLEAVEKAVAIARPGEHQIDRKYVARAQAYRGNCSALAGREAWQVPAIQAHLAQEGLCPESVARPFQVAQTPELFAQIRNAPLRNGAVTAFRTLYRQESDEDLREEATSAFLIRLLQECSRDRDSGERHADPDAFITFLNLGMYLDDKPLAKGRPLPAVAKQFADVIFRDPLPGCVTTPGSTSAQVLETRAIAAQGLQRWIAPADTALAVALEKSALEALGSFRHSATHGATPTNLYAIAVEPLLRAKRHREALAWLRATNMGEPLRYYRQLALLSVALCAKDLNDDATAAAAFDEVSGGGLEVWLRPSPLQSEFAWRLADWYVLIGDWRSAFTVCERCEVTGSAALSDWLLSRQIPAKGRAPQRCQLRGGFDPTT